MKKKVKVFLVHGGMTFKNKRDYLRYLKTRPVTLDKYVTWSGDYLDKKLGAGFEVIRPRMPLSENAKYTDWKISFERYLPLLTGDLVLVGSSLGGIFLAKYLSEHTLPKRALSVFLVCAPFDNTNSNEDLVGGFTLKADLSLIEKNTKNLHLLFSKDDEVVQVAHAEKYKRKLPGAHFVVYGDKNGHFRVPAFPEIIKMIKDDVRKG